jgi:hypothetical protein
MILGFTGTRDGMTDTQRERVAQFLLDEKPTVVHHGDCLGADSQFHDSALLLSTPPQIEIHPCTLTKWRAYRKADMVHFVKSPKDRNRDIVRACDLLIAAPKTAPAESPRSGTWQTVRLALSFKKPVTVIWPDGSVQPWGGAQ